MGRSDYAANSGDGNDDLTWTPSSQSTVEAMTEEEWQALPGTSDDATGITFCRSTVTMAQVRDGSTNTYLVGEKYLRPKNYETGVDWGDDQGWDIGFDYDTNRFTCSSGTTVTHQPTQDRTGYYNYKIFGSAHAGAMNMSLCDGSVRKISYSIDPETHRRLGNRKDGLPIDATKIR